MYLSRRINTTIEIRVCDNVIRLDEDMFVSEYMFLRYISVSRTRYLHVTVTEHIHSCIYSNVFSDGKLGIPEANISVQPESIEW